jgi:hypothetical protein
MTHTFDNHCTLFADTQARRFRWHMTAKFLKIEFDNKLQLMGQFNWEFVRDEILFKDSEITKHENS